MNNVRISGKVGKSGERTVTFMLRVVSNEAGPRTHSYIIDRNTAAVVGERSARANDTVVRSSAVTCLACRRAYRTRGAVSEAPVRTDLVRCGDGWSWVAFRFVDRVLRKA